MTQETQEFKLQLPDDDTEAAYKQAVERAMTRIPVKNGVVNIDSIWVETSIPYDILYRVLKLEELSLPANVERINARSNVRAPSATPSATPSAAGSGGRTARRRRRKKSRSKERG